MSYLTAPPAGAPAAVEAGTLGLGVPGCGHPLLAPGEWAGLTRPGLPLHWAVLDVAQGPGARPDPYCLAAAARLRVAGVRVLGLLDVRHGARPFGELVADASRYLDWYGVAGFHLVRCPSRRTGLPQIQRLTTTLRALRAGAHLVTGHSGTPDAGYADLADQLVLYRGAWVDYRWWQAPEWTAEHPPERFVHLVHGLPRLHLAQALRIARWQGAGTVCLTDRTEQEGAWEALPGYWDDVVSRIGTGVSE
ncbi:spherulation-specific family 4 protein [Streptomyces sp. NPDC059740]|uniref:spherulation-specific family 4 protein n=1 Tax=Streptomyces sp. NPDC059740 TaxID=3346926 RepID=UPI00364663E8